MCFCFITLHSAEKCSSLMMSHNFGTIPAEMITCLALMLPITAFFNSLKEKRENDCLLCFPLVRFCFVFLPYATASVHSSSLLAALSLLTSMRECVLAADWKQGRGLVSTSCRGKKTQNEEALG